MSFPVFIKLIMQVILIVYLVNNKTNRGVQRQISKSLIHFLLCSILILGLKIECFVIVPYFNKSLNLILIQYVIQMGKFDKDGSSLSVEMGHLMQLGHVIQLDLGIKLGHQTQLEHVIQLHPGI